MKNNIIEDIYLKFAYEGKDYEFQYGTEILVRSEGFKYEHVNLSPQQILELKRTLQTQLTTILES
jgi:hypothetical protein